MLRRAGPGFGLETRRDDVFAGAANIGASLRDFALSPLRPSQPHPLRLAFTGVAATSFWSRCRSLCARVRSTLPDKATAALPREVIARRRANDASRPFDGADDTADDWRIRSTGTAAGACCTAGCATALLGGDDTGRLTTLRTRSAEDAPPAPCWECARRRSSARRLPSERLGVIACAMEKLSFGYGFQFTV